MENSDKISLKKSVVRKKVCFKSLLLISTLELIFILSFRTFHATPLIFVYVVEKFFCCKVPYILSPSWVHFQLQKIGGSAAGISEPFRQLVDLGDRCELNASALFDQKLRLTCWCEVWCEFRVKKNSCSKSYVFVSGPWI